MDFFNVDALPIFLPFKTCKEQKIPFLAWSNHTSFLFCSNKAINYSVKLGILLQMSSDIRFVFIYEHIGKNAGKSYPFLCTESSNMCKTGPHLLSL